MITVKIYGLLRLDSGIRELQVQAASIKELLRYLEAKGMDGHTLSGCHILVNGKETTLHCSLSDGDIVQLFPPVAGG